MGFEEVAHTADWSVRVWGKDFIELLSESARAIYSLTGVRMSERPKVNRAFKLTHKDEESLLIAFLNEIIYFQEHDNLAFTTFVIKVQDHQLSATMRGSKILNMEKAIKAITWHNLKIEHTLRGYEAEIVVDV